jgi:hypothetical protein
MHRRALLPSRKTWVALGWLLAVAVAPAHGQTGSASSVGYLDSAIPETMFRLRFDGVEGTNRFDRAAYMYATWAELGFHPHGINGGGVFFDPKAHGINLLSENVSYLEPSVYLEYALTKRFSLFADLPYRFVHFGSLREDNPEAELKRNPADAPAPGSRFFPEPRDSDNGEPKTNENGIADVHFGFKFALLADPDQYLTFQLRTYAPAGQPNKGLGTAHWSIEPSLLFCQRFAEDFTLSAQLTDWIPLQGEAAGNVLQYGLGVSYDVYSDDDLCITPVTELVGWTVLGGFQTFFGQVNATPPPRLEVPQTHGVSDASGITVINVKVGVRTYFCDNHDVYVGYGHVLTGDRWYREIVRVEYRWKF